MTVVWRAVDGGLAAIIDGWGHVGGGPIAIVRGSRPSSVVGWRRQRSGDHCRRYGGSHLRSTWPFSEVRWPSSVVRWGVSKGSVAVGEDPRAVIGGRVIVR